MSKQPRSYVVQGFCRLPWRLLGFLPALLLAAGSVSALEYRMRSLNPTWVEPQTGRVALASGFFDSDRRADMAMCFEDQKVKIFTHDATGQLVLRREETVWDQTILPVERPYPVRPTSCRLHIVDFDRNGIDDIVATHSEGVLVLMLFSNGSVVRNEYGRRGGVFSFAGDGFEDSVVVDVDQDGDMDLVGMRTHRALSLLTNHGDGQLSNATNVGQVPNLSMSGTQLAAGDLDGDGLPDLVVSFLTLEPFSEGGATVLMYSDGDGSFFERRRISHPVPYVMSVPAIGDVTGDGKDDLLLVNPTNQPRSILLVYEQDSIGGLKPPIAYPTYDIPESIKIEDLDGDGLNDVLLLHPTWTSFSSYLQQSDGSLDFHDLVGNVYNLQRSYLGGRQNVVSARDFTGDGCKDLLLATEHYSWADGTGCLPASNADVMTAVSENERGATLRVANLDPLQAAFAVVATVRLDSAGATTFFPAAPGGCTVSAANFQARVYVCRIARLEPGEVRTYDLPYSHKGARQSRYRVNALARVSSHGEDPTLSNNSSLGDFWRVVRKPAAKPSPPAKPVVWPLPDTFNRARNPGPATEARLPVQTSTSP